MQQAQLAGNASEVTLGRMGIPACRTPGQTATPPHVVRDRGLWPADVDQPVPLPVGLISWWNVSWGRRQRDAVEPDVEPGLCEVPCEPGHERGGPVVTVRRRRRGRRREKRGQRRRRTPRMQRRSTPIVMDMQKESNGGNRGNRAIARRPGGQRIQQIGERTKIWGTKNLRRRTKNCRAWIACLPVCFIFLSQIFFVGVSAGVGQEKRGHEGKEIDRKITDRKMKIR